MPWSGGSYTKGNAATGGWIGDATLGIVIEAGRHDTQDNDFATGINNCLTKDGTNSATANINFGGFIPSNVGAGTAAAPAYCAGADVNTGMFSPAADTIAWATNGTERMRISSGGNVGIGLPDPNYPLDIRAELTTGACFQIRGRTSDGISVSRFTDAALGEIARFTSNTTGLDISASGTKILTFGTNSAERMRISSNGQVSIGTTATGATLFVQNNLNNNNSPISVGSNVAGDVGTAAIAIAKKDNNSTTSQSLIQFLINGGATGSGQINANGALQAAFGSFSDARLKENITDLPGQLNKILALRPVEFDYKDGSGHQIGFIAQEVQEHYPDLVAEGKDEYLMLSGLGKNEARLIKAIQELAARVEALEALQAA